MNAFPFKYFLSELVLVELFAEVDDSSSFSQTNDRLCAEGHIRTPERTLFICETQKSLTRVTLDHRFSCNNSALIKAFNPRTQ
ncbi:hypothetical protein TNCT_478401 [Trichonephila clavata]|uniref:Secreted protein n=1 Tax=Trichonephila clavata TaxID=2740835 RepID=A0A8X6FWC2_TRICU|nr:hypothetical protein TNCT_478401 [Trichonephila clavata]